MVIERGQQSGLTIIELTVVILGFVTLLGVVTRVFFAGSEVWNAGLTRGVIRTELSQAIELIVRNVRRAASIDSITGSGITFTADLGNGSDVYRVYLYHPSDPEPHPPYSEDSYELRWVQGDPAYGLGAALARDIARPESSPFSREGDVISVDLTAARGSQSVRMRTKVRPRNL